MIGAWQRFVEGQPPADGEALVYVRYGDPDIENFGRVLPEAEMAIHRGGTLYDQRGGVQPIPYGCWWTSLPHPSIRA